MICRQRHNTSVRADVIGLTPKLNSTGHKSFRRLLESINEKSIIRSFAGI
jgi:hypothetical protein